MYLENKVVFNGFEKSDILPLMLIISFVLVFYGNYNGIRESSGHVLGSVGGVSSNRWKAIRHQ